MRKVFIQTYGCQMNEYDTQQMLQVLATKGFERAESPDKAHLIVINSCSVREKSENKALSQLGRFAALKKQDPSKVLAFGGCVGQTEGSKLRSRYPFLDFVFGTNNYRDLPEMISEYENQWPSAEEEDVLLPRSRPEAQAQAFITITNGCDKFCSYCIVPFTRGREYSRTPEDILKEAAALTQKGVQEIMLLGQNVNSYWGKNKQGAFTSLYDLMVLFQEESEKSLKGLKRLRYTTSHPRDFDENLARAFSELPVLCEYLHLPFQSGSDSVLRKMRRFYTADTYLKKIEMVKRYRPDIALSTDIIVGFPGETRQDFEDTLRVIKEVEFDNIYAFKYSARPYTRSEAWVDDVSFDEKADRIQELIQFQRTFGAKKYKEDIGNMVEIMLEGPSKTNAEFWTGRTRKNRVVHLPTDAQFKVGELRYTKIFDATHSWLSGELIPSGIVPLQGARRSA
ncbi:MAG: tRNA (N6-isopentenyl adenosine(37)-C2)-methylthiotransferase MiaB [Deltaproteobacteria bacterium]|nr:tRNA (N6-isopentenyl adenosine(37)-C2)-methylthiotransferase MiaB [Deltaproteobacteria bacterium]